MARSARVKADGVAHYHVVTRVANKAFLFGDAKRKGRILDFLRRSAEFSGAKGDGAAQGNALSGAIAL